MSIAIKHTKLVVKDLGASERFYLALGLQVVGRNTGGEGDVAQTQSWLSETGDLNSHILILSQFLNFPPPPKVVYPGELWLTFTVSDVDAALETTKAHGGGIRRAGADIPEHQCRAAVVTDPEGHVIEIVGPMSEK